MHNVKDRSILFYYDRSARFMKPLKKDESITISDNN